MIKMSIHQGNVTILDLYLPNNRTLNFLKTKKIEKKKSKVQSQLYFEISMSFPQ